jgi:hypothetical protein
MLISGRFNDSESPGKCYGLPIRLAVGTMSCMSPTALAGETTRGSNALSSRMIEYASDPDMPLRADSAVTAGR